jgi:hypothetical protein
MLAEISAAIVDQHQLNEKLAIAGYRCALEEIIMLVGLGANVAAIDHYGRNVLHWLALSDIKNAAISAGESVTTRKLRSSQRLICVPPSWSRISIEPPGSNIRQIKAEFLHYFRFIKPVGASSPPNKIVIFTLCCVSRLLPSVSLGCALSSAVAPCSILYSLFTLYCFPLSGAQFPHSVARILPSFYPLQSTIDNEITREEIAQLILNLDGELIDSKTPWGWTPLRYSYSRRNVPLMKVLVQRGADVNVKNRDG